MRSVKSRRSRDIAYWAYMVLGSLVVIGLFVLFALWLPEQHGTPWQITDF